MTSSKIILWLLATALLATPALAEAQQPGKIPRIGYITSTYLSTIVPQTDSFRQGLRDLGYLEGKNIVVEWRGADGDRNRQRSLIAELISSKVDVIVTAGSTSTRFAKAATSTIPIVMANDNDPVASGHIASLARPGGNITGLSTYAPELSGKRLEILKEVVPKLSRVAVFWTSTSAGAAQESKEIEIAAKALGVELQYQDVLSPKAIETAYHAAIKGRAEGILMNVSATIAASQRQEIVVLAAKNRLPVIYQSWRHVEAGGLMWYGVFAPDLHRRAAVFVDKILKGTKPADLPVEQPIKFQFTISLKAAKAINLTIPPNVLVRADRVIR